MNKVARDQTEQSAKGIPNKRVGDKYDMGGSAVYLASRAGDYTIGETLTVDGGIVNAHLPAHFADPAGGL
jgi:NAD(P)-dependent dehydrogenase (short-subunit alcohol dehydrogenase family)